MSGQRAPKRLRTVHENQAGHPEAYLRFPARSDVEGPLPATLVGGAAYRHAANTSEFEFPFLKRAHLVGLFETR